MIKMSKEKNWTGNNKSIYTCLGASSHSEKEREINDYYATEPKVIKELFEKEEFDEKIWECACGEGHLSKAMLDEGKNVYSTDLIDRGYGQVKDFLKEDLEWYGDIITNPPYKYAQEFLEKSLKILQPNKKVALFLKIQFLESKRRGELFKLFNPKVVYVYSSRRNCAMNGNFDKYPSSAVCYAWFVWVKGFKGDTIIKWL